MSAKLPDRLPVLLKWDLLARYSLDAVLECVILDGR
jgi:hypothetical protein